MTEREYKEMPVKMPIDAFAREAVHIDSPAACYDCDKDCQKKKQEQNMMYWGGMNESYNARDTKNR